MSKLGAFSQSKLGAYLESKLHARGLPPAQPSGVIWIATNGAGPGTLNFRFDEYGIFYDPAVDAWSYDDHPTGLTGGTPNWLRLASDGATLWGTLSDRSGITQRDASGIWSVIPNPPLKFGAYEIQIEAGPRGLVAHEQFDDVIYEWDGASWSAPADLQPPLIGGSSVDQIGQIAAWRMAGGGRGLIAYCDYPGPGFNVVAVAMDGSGSKTVWPPGPIDVRLTDSALRSAGISSQDGKVAIYVPDIVTATEITGLPFDTSLLLWDVAAATVTALSGKRAENRPYAIAFNGTGVYVGIKSTDAATGIIRNPGSVVSLASPGSLVQLGSGITPPSTGDAVRAVEAFSDGVVAFLGENLTSASPGATSGQSNIFAWDGTQWGPLHSLVSLGDPYDILDMSNP